MRYKGATELNHTLLRGVSLLLSSFCRNDRGELKKGKFTHVRNPILPRESAKKTFTAADLIVALKTGVGSKEN